MTHEYSTREDWLAEAVRRLRPRFNGLEAQPADVVRPLASWPLASRALIGQCLPAEWTADASVYVVVAPVLDDPVEVLAVLLHELVHACGIRGHGRPFAKVARAVGLQPPWRSTTPTDALRADLLGLLEDLGPYPHVKVTPVDPERKEIDPSRRKVRLRSPVDPELKVWMRAGDLERAGAPVCSVTGAPFVEDE